MIKIKLAVGLVLWSFFSLAQAIDLVETFQLALKNDFVLKKSYYSQLSAKEDKMQGIAQLLPTISASARSSREYLNNNIAGEDSSNSQQGRTGTSKYASSMFLINFSQSLFHLDYWIRLKQADNRIAKAKAEHKAELQNLIYKTTKAYFDILAAQDFLEFTISEQMAIDRQLEQYKQRFNVGLTSITDVYEAQAEYDHAKANKIVAENMLDDAREALREIIGENTDNLLSLGNKINFLSPVPNDIEQWSSNAKISNFTILAALNQTEISRKEALIQQSGHLPTLDMVANYSIQSSTRDDGYVSDKRGVGVQLTFPLFQGGLVHSRYKKAQLLYKIDKENLLGIKRQVKRQIRDAFRDVISSLGSVKALQASVVSAQSALEATEAGLVVGTRTTVDVLLAQRNLYGAKKNYSRSRYDYLINGIILKQVAGNLIEQDLVLINKYLVPA